MRYLREAGTHMPILDVLEETFPRVTRLAKRVLERLFFRMMGL